MGMDDAEPLEQVDGGFGGAIGGGFKMVKSSSAIDGASFGAGMEGGWRFARSRLFRSPMKSGGGIKEGGGGGAVEGGGGTNISSSSSTRPGIDITDPLDTLTGKKKRE